MRDVATTGFWPVKGSLKDVVNYADNPDKTVNASDKMKENAEEKM